MEDFWQDVNQLFRMYLLVDFLFFIQKYDCKSDFWVWGSQWGTFRCEQNCPRYVAVLAVQGGVTASLHIRVQPRVHRPSGHSYCHAIYPDAHRESQPDSWPPTFHMTPVFFIFSLISAQLIPELRFWLNVESLRRKEERVVLLRAVRLS